MIYDGADRAYVYRGDVYLGTVSRDEDNGGWRIAGNDRWFATADAAARAVWCDSERAAS